QVSVSLFGANGRYRVETLDKGDVGYIPQGYGHSLENVGDKPCRVLIGFNSGVYEDIDLSEWIGGNPPDVLATNFGGPALVCEKPPRRHVFTPRRGGPQKRAPPPLDSPPPLTPDPRRGQRNSPKSPPPPRPLASPAAAPAVPPARAARTATGRGYRA